MAELKSKNYELIAVFADYGQENIKPTLDSAKLYCDKYNTKLVVVKLPMHWSKSSVIKGNFIDEGITKDNVYSKNVKELSWVPARNAMILLLAGGIASENGIKEVYASFQFDKKEWIVYDGLKRKSKFGAPDLTPRFLLYMNKLADFNYKTKIVFKAPYIEKRLDCKQIVEIGRKLNIDYSNTYSCRYYVNGAKCGTCEQCIIREERLS